MTGLLQIPADAIAGTVALLIVVVVAIGRDVIRLRERVTRLEQWVTDHDSAKRGSMRR